MDKGGEIAGFTGSRIMLPKWSFSVFRVAAAARAEAAEAVGAAAAVAL